MRREEKQKIVKIIAITIVGVILILLVPVIFHYL